MRKIYQEDQQMHLIQHAEQFALLNTRVSSLTNRDHNPPHVRGIYYIQNSTEAHFRRQYLNAHILHSSLFYHLTGILPKIT